MVLSTVISDARTYLQGDSNTLTDADAINLANEAQFSVIGDLIKRGIDAAQVQESYQNATTQVGTYLWPSDMWRLKTMNVNYIDTNQYNYIEATLFDVGNLPMGTSFEQIRYNQSKSSPMFDNRGDWFEIAPAPNSSNSDNLTQFFRIFYYIAPSNFAATTDTVSYPLSLDSHLLASRIAYLASLRGDEDMQSRSKGYETIYGKLLDTIENILKGENQKPITPTGLSLTGYEF